MEGFGGSFAFGVGLSNRWLNVDALVDKRRPQLVLLLIVPDHKRGKCDQQWAVTRLGNMYPRDNPAGRGCVIEMAIRLVKKHLGEFGYPYMLARFGYVWCEVGEPSFKVPITIGDVLRGTMQDVPSHTCASVTVEFVHHTIDSPFGYLYFVSLFQTIADNVRRVG